MTVKEIKITPLWVYNDIYTRYIRYHSVNKNLTENELDKLSREANKLAVKTTWITYNILKGIFK